MTAAEERESGAEAGLKWVRFVQRILLVMLLAVGGLGAALTILATLQARALLEDSLLRRAQSAGRALAHEAFVPIMLEDTEAVERLAASAMKAEDLRFLRIEDADGRILAERREAAAPGGALFEISYPVAPDHPEEANGSPVVAVGVIRLGLDRGPVDAEIRAAVRRNLLIGAGLVSLISLPALWFVRRTALRFQEMVGEIRLLDELRRSNEELQSFAYVASHDLQEPLRMISSYTHLLAERYKGRLDSDADEYIAFAVDGANRMRQLIQGLLAYARIRSQAQPFQEVELGKVLDDALRDLSAAVAESGAQVSRGFLPVVHGDVLQLRQLLQNLVGNAVKYRGKDPPRIEVTALREGMDWRIAVQDNGLGIETKHFERIFRPFQRLHSRSEYEGTGIGLTIVRKIVERHGGRIWVESDGRTGSTFIFTLPAQAPKGETHDGEPR